MCCAIAIWRLINDVDVDGRCNHVDVYVCHVQDEEGEGDGDEDLPPLEEEGADEGSRMEEVD